MSLRRLSAFLDAEELNEQTLDDKVQKVVSISRLVLFDKRLSGSYFRHRRVKERVMIVK